jgi:Na+/H+-dicarboxylate symporter
MNGNFFSRCWRILKTKTLAQILLIIIFCLFAYDKVGEEFISLSYSISLALKSVLVAVLPFLIIGAISTSFAKIPKGGFLFALSLLIGVSVSNFINLTLAYFFGIEVIGLSGDMTISAISIHKIEPIFVLPNIPKIPNGFALIFGLAVGVCCSLFQLKTLECYANKLNKIVMFFMSKIFVRLLPIFIMGFMLKLLAEGEMKQLMDKQLWSTLSVIILICGYLACWFVLASGFRFARLKEIFVNILPAMITAFSTMSSAATLPLALEAAEKNTKDKTLAYSVVPMIMNFHMLGSSMAVSVAVLIIMNAFHLPLPEYSHFAVFGFYFVINKFAGAGVPAGSIIVALPILKKILGFSDDMCGLMLAFYIVFDPIITLANVTANNLFVIFTQKVISIFKPKQKNVSVEEA